jgi:hypothetical protein
MFWSAVSRSIISAGAEHSNRCDLGIPPPPESADDNV